MTYRLDFFLDALPNAGLNARLHFQVRAKENREWAKRVQFATVGRRPSQPLERAQVTFERHSAVEMDPTNVAASMKPVEDALVTVGILANDKSGNYEGGTPAWRWIKAPRGQGGVRIIVEEA